VLEQHIFPRRDPTTPLIWREALLFAGGFLTRN
jgi:hypothetical protein